MYTWLQPRRTPYGLQIGAMISLVGVATALDIANQAKAVADEKPAAFAACIALDALDYIEKAEAEILEEERTRVEAFISDHMSPIAVGETLHPNLGLYLEGALAGLRHALASGAFSDPTMLAECSALDTQLNALLSAQMKEPIFFWHGPRRFILPRLRQLLGGPHTKQYLKGLSPDCQNLRSSMTPEAMIGDTASTSEGQVRSVIEHGVPSVGIVADDRDCGDGKPCKLKDALEAVKTGGATKVHVMVLPSSDQALRNIGVVLDPKTVRKDVFLSFALGTYHVGAVDGQVRVMQAVKEALQALGGDGLDILWLPYAAFPKNVWQVVKPQVEKLLKAGLIRAYGIQAELVSVKVAQGLFEKREPAPVAWLTEHDVLRPADPDAVNVARNLGLAMIARPRSEAPMHSIASGYLEMLGGQETRLQKAAHHRWVLEGGMGLVLEVPAGEEAVLGELQQRSISSAGRQLLDVVGDFSRPYNISVAVDGRKPHSMHSLLQKLHEWQRKMLEPRTDFKEIFSVAAGKSTETGFAPGVSATTLEKLDEQAQTYKANKHVIYKPNFFDAATWQAIVNETKRLWKSHDLEGNCNLDGTNRLGGYVLDHLSKDSSLYELIYGNEPFRRWVSAVNNEGTMWPSDFPIEVREYGTESRGMGCHSDLQMFAVPRKDLEFAVTVDNESKCMVTFTDASGKEHTLRTEPNSVMMVRVNAARHCVGPTKGGHRTILKFIYVGDYRKSRDFEAYKGNECGPDNMNNVALKARRESGSSIDSLEL